MANILLLGNGIERNHCEGAIDEDVFISCLFTLFGCLCNLHGDFQAAPTRRVCNTARELQIAYLC